MTSSGHLSASHCPWPQKQQTITRLEDDLSAYHYTEEESRAIVRN
jgi:hypothetical protein